MMLNRTLIATLLAVTFSFFSSSALAIAITNPGFEMDAAFEDAAIKDLPDPITGNELYTGWNVYLPNGEVENGTYFYGLFVPVGEFYTPPYAPAVNKVAYFDLESAGSVYPVGIQQTLDKDLEANKKYLLSVAVGNPKPGDVYDYSGFGGYRIELLAGGNFLAGDDSSASPGEGLFDTATLSFETGSSHPFLDMALGIRLIHKNEGDSSLTDVLWGIGFDNVQLSVSPVPVPAAVWLFGTALVGLFGFGKRRKTA